MTVRGEVDHERRWTMKVVHERTGNGKREGGGNMRETQRVKAKVEGGCSSPPHLQLLVP